MMLNGKYVRFFIAFRVRIVYIYEINFFLNNVFCNIQEPFYWMRIKFTFILFIKYNFFIHVLKKYLRFSLSVEFMDD